jgi:hypothetical protein
MTVDAVVATTIDVALTFPQAPHPGIDRSHLLQTLEDIFDAGIDCVFLEGDEGIGKTILCAQFAQRHRRKCFSLFIRQFGDLAADPRQIRFDLGNQIHWHLRGVTLDPDSEVHPDDFRNLMIVLQRNVRKAKETFYFILDGVDHACAAHPALRRSLFSVLPVGLPGFKFLLTGAIDQLPEGIRANTKNRPHRVSPFSLSETTRFLEDLQLDPVVIQELHKSFRGNPGRLSAVKRLHEAGSPISAVLDSPASGVFDSEWRIIDQCSSEQVTALAAIAFLRECKNLKRLVDLLGLGGREQELFSFLGKCTFLTVDRESESVTFVSDSFHGFARHRLADKEKEVLDRAISKLREVPDAGETLRALPEYLARANRLPELAQYLDTTRIVAAAKTLHSVSEVGRHLGDLQRRAHVADVEDVEIRCAVVRTVLWELLVSDQMTARVEAALALEQDGAAIALANTRELGEHRLQLLATVASRQRSLGRPPDLVIVDEIKKLVDSIDLTTLGDLAIDVAADLLLVVPDVAAKAIEAYAQARGDPNAFDRAIVRLSVAAIQSAKREVDATAVLTQIDKFARSDRTKNLTKAAAAVVHARDAQVVLDGLAVFAKTSERIYFLRHWIRGYFNEPGAVEVALGGVKWLLADTAYAPNATVFRDLALALVESPNTELTHRLLTFLEGQSEQARVRGPSVDYFRMRFHIATARAKWDISSAATSLEDDALAIDDISDLGVRAACYAWLVRCIRDIGLGDRLEDRAHLREFADEGLDQTVSQLLVRTAEHLEAVKGVLNAVTQVDTERAFRICESLNTEARRNSARALVGEILLKDPPTPARLHSVIASVERACQLITDPTVAQDVARTFIYWLADAADDVTSAYKKLEPLKSALTRIGDPDIRAMVLGAFVGGVSKQEERDSLCAELTETIRSDWSQIEDDALRAYAGSAIITSIANKHRDIAGVFAQEVDEFLKPRAPRLDSQTGWRLLVLLQGRSLATLAALKTISDRDVAAFTRCAQNVLSETERARLVGQCALILSRVDAETARAIIQSSVAPAVATLVPHGTLLTTELRQLMIECIPALWLVNQATALNHLKRLDYPTRQQALGTLMSYVLDMRVPQEPWSEKHVRRQTLTDSVVGEMLNLLDHVEMDSLFAYHVERLLKAVRDRHRGSRLNANMKAHLIASIREMAGRKLPDKRGIQHDGYSVLVEAELAAAERSSHSVWESILRRAKQLPNRSDSCYVLAKLVPLIPRRFQNVQIDCCVEAIAAWHDMATLEERLDRLATISEEWTTDFPAKVRELVEESLSEFRTASPASASSRYRALVEMAYKIDEEWAASLVSITDDDPARALAKDEAARRLDQMSLRKRVAEEETLADPGKSIETLATACWEALGTVAATGVSAVTRDTVKILLSKASNVTLRDAYPIITYVLATMAARTGASARDAELARAVHSALLEASLILESVPAQSANSVTGARTADLLSEEPSTLEILVHPGSRSETLAAVGDWIKATKPESFDVIDPYFRPPDIDLVALIAQSAPGCKVRVLTSRKAQDGRSGDWVRGEWEREWTKLGPPVDRPEIEVYVVGRASDGQMGIHDRWWLTEKGGIECGTSFDGIGRDKTSGIRQMSAQEAESRRSTVEPYFRLALKTHNGERLIYDVLSL